MSLGKKNGKLVKKNGKLCLNGCDCADTCCVVWETTYTPNGVGGGSYSTPVIVLRSCDLTPHDWTLSGLCRLRKIVQANPVVACSVDDCATATSDTPSPPPDDEPPSNCISCCGDGANLFDACCTTYTAVISCEDQPCLDGMYDLDQEAEGWQYDVGGVFGGVVIGYIGPHLTLCKNSQLVAFSTVVAACAGVGNACQLNWSLPWYTAPTAPGSDCPPNTYSGCPDITGAVLTNNSCGSGSASLTLTKSGCP